MRGIKRKRLLLFRQQIVILKLNVQSVTLDYNVLVSQKNTDTHLVINASNVPGEEGGVRKCDCY